MRRNMAQSLFEHGMIRTTLTKAKDLRPFAERLITLARKAHGGSLAARQRLESMMGDRAVIPAENQEEYDNMSDAQRARVLRARSGRRHRLGQPRGGQKFTATSIVHHLIDKVAPRYVDRPGGYTRVIKLGESQHGDATMLAVLQLVGEEEAPGTVTRPEKSARARRAEKRYAFAARAAKKGRTAKSDSSEKADAPAAEGESAS